MTNIQCVEPYQEEVKTEIKKPERVRRVGSFTLGISLISFGMLFLSQLFFKNISYEIFYKGWPTVFILLGIEVLLANSSKRSKFIYDKFSIFLLAAMILFSMFIGMITYAFEYGGYHGNGFYIGI